MRRQHAASTESGNCLLIHKCTDCSSLAEDGSCSLGSSAELLLQRRIRTLERSGLNPYETPALSVISGHEDDLARLMETIDVPGVSVSSGSLADTEAAYCNAWRAEAARAWKHQVESARNPSRSFSTQQSLSLQRMVILTPPSSPARRRTSPHVTKLGLVPASALTIKPEPKAGFRPQHRRFKRYRRVQSIKAHKLGASATVGGSHKRDCEQIKIDVPTTAVRQVQEFLASTTEALGTGSLHRKEHPSPGEKLKVVAALISAAQTLIDEPTATTACTSRDEEQPPLQPNAMLSDDPAWFVVKPDELAPPVAPAAGPSFQTNSAEHQRPPPSSGPLGAGLADDFVLDDCWSVACTMVDCLGWAAQCHAAPVPSTLRALAAVPTAIQPRGLAGRLRRIPSFANLVVDRCLQTRRLSAALQQTTPPPSRNEAQESPTKLPVRHLGASPLPQSAVPWQPEVSGRSADSWRTISAMMQSHREVMDARWNLLTNRMTRRRELVPRQNIREVCKGGGSE